MLCELYLLLLITVQLRTLKNKKEEWKKQKQKQI